ncbi:MAG: lipopolysaccharide biosynthesis protein [Candidatus Scalindua sp.]
MIIKNQQTGLSKRVASGLIWNQIYIVLSFGISLAFQLFIVRQFDRYTYSIYIFAAGFVGIVLTSVSFGFENIINKYIPEYLSKGKGACSLLVFKRFLLLRFIILLNICVVILLARKLLVSLLNVPEIATLIGFLLAVILVRGTYNLFPSMFMAQLKVKQARIIESCEQALHLLVVCYIFVILQSVNIKQVFLAQFIIDGIILILYWVLLHKSWQGTSAQSENVDFRSLYKFGLYFCGTDILTYLLAERSDVLLLGLLNPDKEQIGIYNVGTMIGLKISVLVLGSLRGLLLPALSEAYARRKAEGLAQAWQFFLKVILIAIIPTFSFLFIYADQLIINLFTKNYIQSANILKLSVGFGISGWLLGSGLSMIVLMTLNKGKTVLWTRLGAGMLNLLLNIILIPSYGAIGAIIGTGVSQLSITIIEFEIMRRYVKVIYPFLFLGKLLFVSSISLLAIIWLPAKELGQLAVNGGIFLVLFLSIAYFVKFLTPDERQRLSDISVLKYLARLF